MARFKIGLVLILIGFCACGPSHPNSSGPASAPAPSAESVATTEASAVPEPSDYEIAMTTKAQKIINARNYPSFVRLPEVAYSNHDELSIFVGPRCNSILRKMAAAPKSKANLFDDLAKAYSDAQREIGRPSDMGELCNTWSASVHVVPGKKIESHYSENHILAPDLRNDVTILLGPGFTVRGFEVERVFGGTTDDSVELVQGHQVLKMKTHHARDFFESHDREAQVEVSDFEDGSEYYENLEDYGGNSSKVLFLPRFTQRPDGSWQAARITEKRGENKYCELEVGVRGNYERDADLEMPSGCFSKGSQLPFVE